jgi:hypothetical protein
MNNNDLHNFIVAVGVAIVLIIFAMTLITVAAGLI